MIAILKTIIFFILILPAFAITIGIEAIIPFMITFIVLLVIAIKKRKNMAILFNATAHLFCILSHSSMTNGPGLDDSFSTLGVVLDGVFYSCLFAGLAIASFILYGIFLKRSKDNTPDLIIKTDSRSQKFCLHCGTANDVGNNNCTNCGWKL